MSTLKVLSALLSYPTEELVRALPEIAVLLGEDGRLSRRDREALADLLTELMKADVLDAQERYVEIFDRGRSTALHLFEHVHGDSRDRGQAMVDLNRLYARAGFDLATHELPDFLPAMLEFLSYRPDSETQEVLGDCAHILRSIGETLQTRESRYAAIFGALLSVIGADGLSAHAKAPRPEEKSMDEEWAETPAFDGLGSCSSAQAPKQTVIRIVRRAA